MIPTVPTVPTYIRTYARARYGGFRFQVAGGFSGNSGNGTAKLIEIGAFLRRIPLFSEGCEWSFGCESACVVCCGS
jgi:hypothetical protein